MDRHLQICHDGAGSWSVHGLSPRPATFLPSLADSIAYARSQCGGAPATIELMIDGFYAVLHQDDGWPREILFETRLHPSRPRSLGTPYAKVASHAYAIGSEGTEFSPCSAQRVG